MTQSPSKTTPAADPTRNFARPPLPNRRDLRNVYFIKVAGTGMGSLAGMFHDAGIHVRGSDEAVYPPMSTQLVEWGVELLTGYDPARLDPPPDLVVVGNACSPTHIEAQYAREHQLVQASFPEALGHFFIEDRHAIVICGTHGKTTTTALAAHALTACGEDPGYLVGGVLKATGKNFRLGAGTYFAVEGDEYDSAYFDKNPKFLHYRARSAVITSVELDHIDIYPTLDLYVEQFRRLAREMAARRLTHADQPSTNPASTDGGLTCCADDKGAADIAAWARRDLPHLPVTTYGFADGADYVAANPRFDERGSRFLVFRRGPASSRHNLIGEASMPLHGPHNILNALSVIAVLDRAGVAAERVIPTLASFGGLKRRQDVYAEPHGIALIDDFAHHPTAVRETIKAIRARFGTRRLLAIFEPRSNTSRTRVFQREYAVSFDGADLVLLSETTRKDGAESAADRFSSAELASDLRATGLNARAFDTPDAILATLLEEARTGDVMLIMSNGSFGGLHAKLANGLAAR